MPWKEWHVMDARLRFVARLLDGERITTLYEEFGISRKTGYKIYDRYKAFGAQGLTDRSRRPLRHANQLPVLERQIVQLKKRYPTWAPKDSREASAAVRARTLPRHQRRACGARSAWPGASPEASAAVPDRHPTVTRQHAERALHGLQRGISARGSSLLLSVDDHRFRQSVSPRL